MPGAAPGGAMVRWARLCVALQATARAGIAARVLTVLADLFALVGMVVSTLSRWPWTRTRVRDHLAVPDRERRDRTQVAAKSVETLFENVDAEAAIAERLPAAQEGLARVVAGLARRGPIVPPMRRSSGRRVQSVRVQAMTRTQRQRVRLLDDETTFIRTEGGAVVLDLRPIVIELGDQVAVIGVVAEGSLVRREDRNHRGEPARDGAVGDEVLRTVADWMRLERSRLPPSRSGLSAGVGGSSCARSRSASSSSDS